jgi:hypothetical protein
VAAHDHLSELGETVNRLRQLKDRLGRWTAREDHLGERATVVREQLAEIEGELTSVDVKGWNLIRVLTSRPAALDLRLARIVAMLAGSWDPVPASTRQVTEELMAQVGTQVALFNQVLAGPVAHLETELRRAGEPVLDTGPAAG